jgi:hypothetical protein
VIVLVCVSPVGGVALSFSFFSESMEPSAVGPSNSSSTSPRGTGRVISMEGRKETLDRVWSRVIDTGDS